MAFCDTHVKGKFQQTTARSKEPLKCKKCGYELQESKMLSMSTRRHAFGRQTKDEATGYYTAFRGEGAGTSNSAEPQNAYDGEGFATYAGDGFHNLRVGDESSDDYEEEAEDDDSAEDG